MKKLLFLILTVAFVFVGIAQKQQPKYVQDAKNSFSGGLYAAACEKAEKAYNKLGSKASLKDRGEMAYLVAESNRYLERFDKAKNWYNTSIDLKYYQYVPEVYFYKGEMLRMENEFNAALEQYRLYEPLASKSMKNVLEMAIEGCRFYEDFNMFESRYELNEELKLNDPKAFDMAPFTLKKGKETFMYFGSNRNGVVGSEVDGISGDRFLDIFLAKFDKGELNIIGKNASNWINLDEKGVINQTQNEGTICFDSKFKMAYFTRCENAKGKNLGCDIWSVEVKGKPGDLKTKFSKPVKLNLKASDTISIGHPCIIDDQYLVFVSDAKEIDGQKSYGGKDLWYVEYDRKTKSWDGKDCKIKNMGPQVNSYRDELFPTYSPNEKIFYFSSNGHKGIGGLDIFRMKKSDTSFSFHTLQNLDYPFNSQSNDYAMSVVEYVSLKSDSIFEFKEKNGYFTTERKSENYTPDIWSFDLPPLEYSLQVMVYELGNKAKKISGANVEVTVSDGDKWNGMTGEKISEEKVGNWGKTDVWAVRDKTKRYILPGKEYTIKASKSKYYTPGTLPMISTLNEDEGPDFYVEIPLIPIEIRTPEVRYPLDQWSFIHDESCKSKDSLKFLVDLMKNNPTLLIELYSHTDARDTEKHNKALSQNRAVAVYNHLVENGIEPERMKPIGMGESEPATIMVNGSEQVLTESYINKFKSDRKEFERLHQINRRTTVRILVDENEVPLEFPTSKITVEPSFSKYITPLPR